MQLREITEYCGRRGWSNPPINHNNIDLALATENFQAFCFDRFARSTRELVKIGDLSNTIFVLQRWPGFPIDG